MLHISNILICATCSWLSFTSIKLLDCVCSSIAENAGRSDWKDVLQGKDDKDSRSGMTIYGTTKLFNIMLAKEYSRRLQARQQVTSLCNVICSAYVSWSTAAIVDQRCCHQAFNSVTGRASACWHQHLSHSQELHGSMFKMLLCSCV